MNAVNGADQPAYYQIRVYGRLDEEWSDWLDGMSIAYDDGITTCTGLVVDQSALLGILTRLCHMNLTLLLVRRLEGDRSDEPPSRV